MTEQPTLSDLAGVLLLIEDNYDKILSSIINEYSVEKDTAERLHRRRNKHYDDWSVYQSNEKWEGRTAS